MDRRTFIAGATGFGLLGAARAFAGTQTPPRLRFGVISDLHLKDAKSCARYARALRWFDAQRADAVLCCGDLTDWGLSHQLKMVADTWRAVFPGDRRSDGAPIARLFLYGDHDNGGYAHHHFGSSEAAQRLYGFTAAEVEAMAIRQSGAARRWEEAFGEAYEPIFVREVKGYRFVLANFTMDGGAANPRGDNTPGAEATPAVTRLVYSDRCARPEAEETLPVVCPFAVDEFPVGAHVRFEVRARNAFGRCGAPLEVAG